MYVQKHQHKADVFNVFHWNPCLSLILPLQRLQVHQVSGPSEPGEGEHKIMLQLIRPLALKTGDFFNRSDGTEFLNPPTLPRFFQMFSCTPGFLIPGLMEEDMEVPSLKLT